VTRYRIVCANGTVSSRVTCVDRQAAERRAAYEDASFTCGPHRVEEVDES